MRNLKLFYKQFIRYFFLFIVAVFLASNVFVCHIYASGTVDLDHDLSDSCHTEEEGLLGQGGPQFFVAGNKIQTQNNQKFTPDFNSETSEKLSSLIQQKDTSFIFSEDLSNSQITQLLAVVKIE